LALIPVVFVKCSVVFVIVLVLTVALKNVHPRIKYLLWVIFFASLISVPFFHELSRRMHAGITRVIKSEQVSHAVARLSLPASERVAASKTIQPVDPIPPDNAVQKDGNDTLLPFLGLCGLVTGMLISSVKLVVGALRLARFRKRSLPVDKASYASLLAELSREMNIKGTIALLQSERCRVPFTYGIERSLVFIPQDVEKWPREHLRAVLKHELVHIKRRDYAAKLFVRIMCSLFWYMPFVWVAYSNLCAEQEKACDTAIVESGTNPAGYARVLINVARAAREQLLSTCIFVAKQKRSLLRTRIMNILAIKGGKKMKRNMTIGVLTFLFAAIIGLGGFATDTTKHGFYIPEAKEEIAGTWINTSYSGNLPMFQKLVSHSWGYYEIFAHETDERPTVRGTMVLTDKWTDTEGNIWYKLYFRENMESYFVRFQLARISENGKVWEFVHSTADFPAEDDLISKRKGKKYHIYYRQ
jgi:beta-lactamase regulating signal transducer with metallopeptidase domain